jgi:hypothetical protein
VLEASRDDTDTIHISTQIMKLSALALALLATPFVGTAAQHSVVGGGVSTKYKKMIRGADLSTTSIAGPRLTALPLLNAAAGDDDTNNTDDLVTTCASLSASGQSGCNANDSCSWCLSGAIPSACYPATMTARLPAGVFQCDKTTAIVEAAETPAAAAAATAVSKKVQTFNLKESITLTLSSAEVDKSFCDASSPLSLAGYMNGECDAELGCTRPRIFMSLTLT